MTKRSVAGTPADPTIKFTEVRLDGDCYMLAYSFNAIAKAERVAGCNLLSGLENLSDLTAAQLLGLFYAALSVGHPRITIEEAGSLVRLDTMGAISSAIAEAYRLSMPERKANPPEPGAPAAES